MKNVSVHKLQCHHCTYTAGHELIRLNRTRRYLGGKYKHALHFRAGFISVGISLTLILTLPGLSVTTTKQRTHPVLYSTVSNVVTNPGGNDRNSNGVEIKRFCSHPLDARRRYFTDGAAPPTTLPSREVSCLRSLSVSANLTIAAVRRREVTGRAGRH